jgi:hypothetical protein
VLWCVRAKVGKDPISFVFTRANPGSRPVASPPPEGTPARERTAYLGVEQRPAYTPQATDLNLAVGPHVVIWPNGVQLRPSVLVGLWGRIQGGSVDFGPLDQLGRAHWATFGPVAHSAHYQPLNP